MSKQVKPNFSDAYLTLSQLLSTLNRDQEALDCLNEAKGYFDANFAQSMTTGDLNWQKHAKEAMAYLH